MLMKQRIQAEKALRDAEMSFGKRSKREIFEVDVARTEADFRKMLHGRLHHGRWPAEEHLATEEIGN
jgi:hypothetical protein